MTNVVLAAKRTTTDVLQSVTVTTQAINQGISSIAHLAEAGSQVASDYRDQVIANSAARTERYKHSAALNDAHFYLDLQKDLAGNEELKKLYDQSLALRNAASAPVPTSIAAE